MVDFAGGYVGAMALLAGVHAARRDGTGMDCDISLYDIAVTLPTYPATWYLNANWTPVRTSRSAHPSLVPFQLFQGGDDEWFVVGCAKEKFFQRLTGVVGRPGLATDARFASFSARAENKEEIISILNDIFATRPAADWIAELKRLGVLTGPVQDVAATMSDPHTLARGLVVETKHERFGTIKSLASPVRVGDLGDVEYRRAPVRNEHADELLRDLLSYDEEQVEHMRAEGAFGDES